MHNTNSHPFSFHPSSSEEFKKHVSSRPGETKLGERIKTGTQTQNVKFILLGIEESIGPQANRGFEGAQNAFGAFISRFANMQSNRFLDGSEIHFIGTIKQNENFTNEDNARSAIEILDDLVVQTLNDYVKANVIPIVIGGGHNNAYPLIKCLSDHKKHKLDVVNLDPHADCRALEGRHSGNPFSYAKENGFLNHYAVLGLHKAYNSEFILNYLDSKNFFYTFFEEYILDPKAFTEDIHSINLKLKESQAFGIELDLDSIHFMPSSAFTPSGFSVEQARYYLKTLAKNENCAYLHIPEGAPTTLTEEKIVGKSIAYLVWDFISSISRN